jgi:hypothetical protein
MSRRISFVYSPLCLLAICIAFMISSCGHGADESWNPGGPGGMPPGTGGVAFRLVWQQPLFRANAQFTPSFNACVDRRIDTIAATVSDGTTTVTSDSWPCSAHEGLIIAIPSGSNYTVQIIGMSSGPTTTTWTGLASPVIVNTGQITNAGTIVMTYVGGDTTRPNVTSIAPHSNSTGTTDVPITARINIAFDKPMAISTITANNITLNNGSVSGTVSYNAATHIAAFTPSAALAYSTEYVVKVISCVTPTCITDTAGNLVWDYQDTFSTESGPTDIPAAPSTGLAAPGNGQVTLDWLASNGATSYNIHYGLTSGSTNTIISNVRPPFVHLGLPNGQTYYYVVFAVNSYGASASAEASGTPAFPTGNPLPPASITVDPSSGQNIITWAAVSGATSYNLYWSTTPITPDKYAADNVVRGVGSPYTHAGLMDALPYCYIITAMNANGESADSKQACGGVGSIQLYW